MGTEYGCRRCGFATFISNCVACLYFFVLLLIKRGKTYVCINPKQFSFHRDIVSGVCAVGVPASIQNLLNVTGMTILNNFSSAYGADAVAAIGICQKIYMVPMYVSQGISQGVMPLVSYNYSSGQRCPHEARRQLCPSGCLDGHHLGGCALLPLPRLLGIPVYEE